jgi:Domain of unknown function (DUF4281)
VNPEAVFGMTGTPAILGWAILILGPRRYPWLNAIPQLVIPIGLSALYAVLVLRYFAQPGGGFDSLAGVRQLFTSDWTLLAGWVHYLAFDLAIGAYIATRMDRAGIGRLIQAPVLVTTFLLGPIGFLLAILMEAALSARLPLPSPRNARPQGLIP